MKWGLKYSSPEVIQTLEIPSVYSRTKELELRSSKSAGVSMQNVSKLRISFRICLGRQEQFISYSFFNNLISRRLIK